MPADSLAQNAQRPPLRVRCTTANRTAFRPAASSGGRGYARRLSRAVVAVTALLLAASPAGATTIFFENFEGIPNSAFTADGGRTKPGLPLVSEGAMETWFGGRFEPSDNGTINQDIAVRHRGDVYPAQHKYARFEDDVGMLLNISTLGQAAVDLTFQWLTHNLDFHERLKVGYYVGEIVFPGPTPEPGANAAYMRDFYVDGPTWSSWTQLMEGKDHSAWQNETFGLPVDESSVWVAFWVDAGEGEYGKIDNILVTGTPVPEPGTALLLVLGLVALGMRRRR